MASEARDSTEDWLIPEAARAQSFSQLEARIHAAATLARSAEAAVSQVGAAAIESAEQARQAAELAERAAIAAEAASSVPAVPAVVAAPSPLATNAAVFPLPSDEDLRLSQFVERADRLVARLRLLQQV